MSEQGDLRITPLYCDGVTLSRFLDEIITRFSEPAMKLRGAAWLSACMLSVSCVAQRQDGVSPQKMLDFLAKPMPANSRMALPSTFPPRFADWTEAQKQSGLQLVAQRCGQIYALERDNPATRLLPNPMAGRDEAGLAMAVCAPAKMPTDWPDRRKFLDNAQRLITEANTYGAALHLPEILTRK